MIKSMTGFGRGTSEDSNRSFVVEMKSVNHRYSDINIKMPKILISLEDRIRKSIQKKVSRGKVDVYVTLNSYDKSNIKTTVNTALADNYYKCLQEIKGMYSVRDDISVSLIARYPEVIMAEQEEEDIEKLWGVLSKSLDEAIDMLVQMREKEGMKLQENILQKCDIIKSDVDKIEIKSPLVVNEYKEKLSQRLKELLDNSQIDENRIATEVALFADKACIDEEIVRLNSHIIQMRDTLNLCEPVGRKLDFIIQEMNREVNTIASKANNIEISKHVLNLKNEIEKIREQIQNVE